MAYRLSCGFKVDRGDWKNFRKLGSYIEIKGYHNEDSDRGPYWEEMEAVYDGAKKILESAYEDGIEYVIFTHGWSTSRRGRTTNRSQIRKLMRCKDATPYIIRKECIQHYSVFVAAIRPKPEVEK